MHPGVSGFIEQEGGNAKPDARHDRPRSSRREPSAASEATSSAQLSVSVTGTPSACMGPFMTTTMFQLHHVIPVGPIERRGGVVGRAAIRGLLSPLLD